MGGSNPTPAPSAPSNTQTPATPNTGVPNANPASSDKPFDDEPFDAGVEADETTDPKKYIEQLSGKLGQSLRKYTETQGSPDFELEKFAVNSVLSATHTSEMDGEDQNDIIKKVKEAGNHDENANNDSNDSGNTNTDNNNPSDSDNSNDNGFGMDDSKNNGDENVKESEKKDENFLVKPKKLSIFAPEGSEEAKFNIKSKLKETFNQGTMHEPITKPIVKPAPTKTPTQPSRKNKPFLPSPSVQPTPKATKEVAETTKGTVKVDSSVLARELASMSKNVNDLIAKQDTFFNNKEIDSKLITKIIAQAAEIIKNR